MTHEYEYDCNCATCIEVDIALHRASSAAMSGGRALVDESWRERALRAEAEVRALRETVGELLELVDAPSGVAAVIDAEEFAEARRVPPLAAFVSAAEEYVAATQRRIDEMRRRP